MKEEAPNCQVEIGDVVFIQINNWLYARVSEATQSWTTHVGVVVDERPGRVIVAESAVPLTRNTTLAKFVKRSRNGLYSIKRFHGGLTPEQKTKIQAAAARRMNKLYHMGFDYDSERQFCSKFVYEVYQEALGVEIGRLETFEELLNKNEATSLWFWKLWYFGSIPWNRRTVTPASQYECGNLSLVAENL